MSNNNIHSNQSKINFDVTNTLSITYTGRTFLDTWVTKLVVLSSFVRETQFKRCLGGCVNANLQFLTFCFLAINHFLFFVLSGLSRFFFGVGGKTFELVANEVAVSHTKSRSSYHIRILYYSRFLLRV